MSLVKTVSGLLFSDNFNRADEELQAGADWEGSTILDLISNEIKSDPTDTSGFELCLVKQATVAQSGEMVVQCRVLVHDNFNFSTPGAGIALCDTLSRFRSFGLEIRRWQAAPSTFDLFYTTTGLPVVHLVEDESISVVFDTYYTIKLWVKDSFQRAWFDTVQKADFTYAGNDAFVFSPGISKGGSGLVSGTFAKYDDFFAYAGNVVTVSGLQTGYKAKIAGVTVTETAGSAAVDIAGASCPIPKIEILSGSDELVESITPVGGVYGGDTWVFSEPWVQDAAPAGSWVQDG